MTAPSVATGHQDSDVVGGLAGGAEAAQQLEARIAEVAHLLPAQGPIEVFVHHNTLHAFEHLPFEEAVRAGRQAYGGAPYWPEERYREMLSSGRIHAEDLRQALGEDLRGQEFISLGSSLGPGRLSRLELRLAMLEQDLYAGPDSELHWVIAETDALRRFRPDVAAGARARIMESTRQRCAQGERSEGVAASPILQDVLSQVSREGRRRHRDAWWEEVVLRYLWRVCRRIADACPLVAEEQPEAGRIRDVLLEATGEDTDRYVHELLIRFTAAFLDQGSAQWELPHRELGYWRSFLNVYGRKYGPGDAWLVGLGEELRRLNRRGATAMQSIQESLDLLGVGPPELPEFLERTLLALGGWAGMVWQLEHAATWVDRPAPKGSLIEFLAVRLILERQAIAFVAREHLQHVGPLSEAAELARRHAERRPPRDNTRDCLLLFQVAQSLGWAPHELDDLSVADARTVMSEVKSFDSLTRRRIFHEAYERHYRVQALDAIAAHCLRRGRQADSPPERPAFQLVTCIDDREESFRRHVEEISPDCETLGAAGFFAVAMNYQGVADANYRPLCPAVITPTHYVKEDVGYTFEGEHRRRTETRRRLGWFTHQVRSKSRTFFGGAMTALAGSMATFPLIARVLFPRLTARFRERFGRWVQPPSFTQLQLERYQDGPGPENGHIGFTLEEMTEIVARLLQDLGLTGNFARVVVIMGHGSASLNNPHESAYNCGACAGKRGGANARAFAQMANDWRVRGRLAQQGFRIPDDTVFLGSYHNTCDDAVVWYDLDRLPASHRNDFEQVKRVVAQARARNAHERCRRFDSASLQLTPKEALQHVEGRAQDLSQVRPEYNHATNALCLVGRRHWSRGLFLDRRAFLASYDPAQDDADCPILSRILAAAIPVCAGISLEYYFSCVDTTTYGSGSKLPHNIVSLLGVMEGASSDLRTGLHQQMIEIHEPMRILFVIETTPDAMLEIMDRQPVIGRLCRGSWVQLAVLDADSGELQLYRRGRFEPHQPTTTELPLVNQSAQWYRGRRDNLGFATIREAASS